MLNLVRDISPAYGGFLFMSHDLAVLRYLGEVGVWMVVQGSIDGVKDDRRHDDTST